MAYSISDEYESGDSSEMDNSYQVNKNVQCIDIFARIHDCFETLPWYELIINFFIALKRKDLLSGFPYVEQVAKRFTINIIFELMRCPGTRSVSNVAIVA